MPRTTFEGYELTSTDAPIGAFAVTPGPGDLPRPIRMVTINGAGTITWRSSIDGQTNTTGVLPVGTYPMQADRITAATATDITGWV